MVISYHGSLVLEVMIVNFNLGIVTRFDLHTFPIRNIWYTANLYAATQVSDILQAFAAWETQGAVAFPESSVLIEVALGVVTVGLVYSTPANNPIAFEPFYKIPPLVVAAPPTNGTIVNLTAILGASFTQLQPR